MRVNKNMSVSTVNLTRHYYQQCQQLWMFPACFSSSLPPHWGNTCPKIADTIFMVSVPLQHKFARVHVVSNEECQYAFHVQDTPKDDFWFHQFKVTILGPNSGKACCVPHAVLHTGADSTYINNRRLLDNITPYSLRLSWWLMGPFILLKRLVHSLASPQFMMILFLHLKKPHWYFTYYVYGCCGHH